MGVTLFINSITALASGWLVARGVKGAYYIQVAAAYNAKASLGIGMLDRLPAPFDRAAAVLISTAVMSIGKMELMLRFFGKPHLSAPVAMGLLVAGVLILLVGVVLNRIQQMIDWYFGVRNAICDRIHPGNVATAIGNQMNDLRTHDALSAADGSFPRLPEVMRP